MNASTTCHARRLIIFGLSLLCVVSVITACYDGDGSDIEGDSGPFLEGSHDAKLPYQNLKWMAKIPDSKYLSEIMIPGTHDTGADLHTSNVLVGIKVITQDFFFSNQLRLGVRWFDVRLRLVCEYTKDEALTVHHSSYYLHKIFDHLLVFALDFLKQNPTETLVFMIKQEYSAEPDSHFGWHVYERLDHYGLENFYLKNEVPTMGEARGKIVIVRQFKNKVSKVCEEGDFWCKYQNIRYYGNLYEFIPRPPHKKYDPQDFGMQFNWTDNTRGESYVTDGIDYYVQDHYYFLNADYAAEKKGQIQDCLKAASKEENLKKFYVNFTSLYYGGENIYDISRKINAPVEGYLKENSSYNRGVIMINFAGGSDTDNRGASPNLVQTIIDQNFR